jgi:NTE family protein
MNRALVFAGGGSKGGYSASKALRLHNAGRRYSILGGESIGACNALLYAVAGPHALVGIWPGLRAKDIYRGGGKIEQILTLAGAREGIYDMTPSLATLARLTAGRRILTDVRVIVTVTDLATGAMLEHTLTSDTPPSAVVEKVYQSCLVPLAHGARDGRYADGGVSATAPLGPAVRSGAEHVDVLLLDRLGIDPWAPTRKALEQAGRAVELLRENAYWKDLEGTVLRNRLATAGDPDYRRVEATLYAPQGELHGWMDWSPERSARWPAMTWDEYSLLDAYQLMKRRREEAVGASLAG